MFRCSKSCAQEHERYNVPGHALLLTLIVLIVLSSLAVAVLQLLNLGYDQTNRLARYVKGRNYCIQAMGSAYAKSSYNNLSAVRFHDGFTLVYLRERWGAFDCFSTIVLRNDSDTIISKAALIGYQQDAGCNTSIFLRGTGASVSIGDNMSCEEECYFPSGTCKYLTTSPDHGYRIPFVVASPDTLPEVIGVDSMEGWLGRFEAQKGNAEILDTIKRSFFSEKYVISGDTITLDGCLSGKIVVVASRVVVGKNACLEDVVVVANSIRICDSFTGNAQFFAADSLSVGNGVRLEYPSALVLMPSVGNAHGPQTPMVMIIGSACRIVGDVIGFSPAFRLPQRMNVIFRDSAVLQGGVYSSGGLSFKGRCAGMLVADRMFSSHNGVISANYLDALQVTPMPDKYVSNNLFPFGKRKKVAKWLK